MTRRTLLALPVALAVPAVSTATPEVTIYLGKFEHGTGPFVRRKVKCPGPWISKDEIQTISYEADIRAHYIGEFRREIVNSVHAAYMRRQLLA